MPSTIRREETALSMESGGAGTGVGGVHQELTATIGTAYGTSGLILAPATGADLGKDPERSPLLPTVLLRQPSWVCLNQSEILALADDPFWCCVRRTLLACFWLFMMSLVAAVAVIVALDPQRCSERPPPPQLAAPGLHQLVQAASNSSAAAFSFASGAVI